MQAKQAIATSCGNYLTTGPGASAPGLSLFMPDIKTVRVVSVSDLFSADDLELFQNEVNNQ